MRMTLYFSGKQFELFRIGFPAMASTFMHSLAGPVRVSASIDSLHLISDSLSLEEISEAKCFVNIKVQRQEWTMPSLIDDEGNAVKFEAPKN